MTSKDELTVAVLPINIVLGNKELNIMSTRCAMDNAPAHADILVLPELFSTGYTNDPAVMRKLAESNDGPAMESIHCMAAEFDVAIAGSFAAMDADGRCYNRAFFVQPDGHTTFYNKRHLFSVSREAEVFGRSTDALPVIPFRGWNVAISVCYDLRFPAWMRNRNYAYDLMLLPANWPQARSYALEHLLIARAIENQAPIVCANRSGSDPYGTYDGCSYAFDHMGRPAFAPDSTMATFSLEKILEARERFPAARDADSFSFDN